MAKKEYAFYPGCSSQAKSSAANYLTSVNTMCDKLDIKLTEIPIGAPVIVYWKPDPADKKIRHARKVDAPKVDADAVEEYD